MMKRFLYLLLSFSLALAAGGSLWANNKVKLPDLGSSSDEALSEDREQAYRDEILQQMHQYNFLIKDPVISSYIYHLGYRLAMHSGKPENDFKFFAVPLDVVNASAYPGGLIVIFAGLILETNSESELAGVIAHEIAHVNQRHISRQFAKQKKSAVPFLLGMVAALAAAQNSSSDDAGIAAVAGISAMQQQMSINFTRFNEYEADRVGINTLHASGLNPDGMASFFSTLMRKNRVDDRYKIPEYLRTHPLSVNRVAEARNRIKSLPIEEVRESQLYDFVKERLRILMSRELSGLESYYAEEIRQKKGNLDALRYAYSLVLSSVNKPQKALEVIEQINYSPEINALLIDARIDALERLNPEQALQSMEQALRENPNNMLLTESAVHLFVKHGNLDYKDRAVRLARDLTQRQPDNPHFFDLLSIASQSALKTIKAGEAMARREHIMGRNYRAVRILRNLLKEDVDYYQRAEINALISEFELLISPQERRREIAEENGSAG